MAKAVGKDLPVFIELVSLHSRKQSWRFKIVVKIRVLFLLMGTLPKTNIAPEHRLFQKERSLPTINFQGRAVSFREGTPPKFKHGN